MLFSSKHDFLAFLAPSISEPKADFGPARQDLALRALRCPARASHRQARARATQTSTHRARKAHTLTELGKHTQKSANIRTTHKGKNNTTDGARAKRAPHRYCCWRARSARPLCVWCECWRHVCVLALGSLTLYT